MRIFVCMLMTALFVGSVASCKTREPEQAGLLSAESEISDDTVADGGEYSIRCGAEDDAAAPVHVLLVRGAVSATDESQALIVDVDQFDPGTGKATRLLTGIAGRGAVDLNKSVFIGFERGALTTDVADDATGGFVGVLSIVDHVEGLAVRCQVSSLKPDPK